MLISLDWVKEYLDLPVNAKELAVKTTMTSQEVDEIIEPAKGLKKIVIGKTIEVIPMPGSDHLKICQVDVGEKNLSQIVCGAPNISQNQNVIIALPGARIKNNVKIKRSKMRGYESNGMICSLEEIGFSSSVVPKEFANGIYIFPHDLKVTLGDSVFSYLGMNDHILDLDLTPNRGDLQSIRGASYEFGAFYHLKPHFQKFNLKTTSDDFADKFKVSVTDSYLVPVYQLRNISNVKIDSSPQWLKNRLWNAGIRPINNIVDITNYVMYLYGQPLHAFDANTIQSKHILVRKAKDKEIIKTLDGINRELKGQDLVVTDGKRPIAIAGIMGDLSHEITEGTTNILLESAIFNSQHVRETAKRLNLRSESSIRFERGINSDTVSEAIDYAAYLIQKIAGGTVSQDVLFGSKVELPKYHIMTNAKAIGQKIGLTISTEQLTSVLNDLAISYKSQGDNILVNFPHRRPDLMIEEDLDEEVARIIGYDKLPMTLPKAQINPALLTPLQALVKKSRQIMIGCGFSEIMNYTLVPKDEIEDLTSKVNDTIILPNPMTKDHEVVRRNLRRGMLDVLHYNQMRSSKFQHLFEIGHTYTGNIKRAQPFEHTKLAVALSGKYPNTWLGKGENVNFYDLSGILTSFMKQIGIKKSFNIVPQNSENFFHPGQSGKIMIDNNQIGVIGKINPNLEHRLDLLPTYIFEIELNKLLEYPRKKFTKITVPKLNPVERDISFFVSKKYHNQDLILAIQNLNLPHLSQIELFDIYSPDEKVNSYAYTLTFSNNEKTLTDEEINAELANITSMLQEKFSAKIR